MHSEDLVACSLNEAIDIATVKLTNDLTVTSECIYSNISLKLSHNMYVNSQPEFEQLS